MSLVKVRRFLHGSKESNYDLVDKYGHQNLAYCCYEVELLVEINTETGESKVIGCDGQFLGGESYQDEEIEVVE